MRLSEIITAGAITAAPETSAVKVDQPMRAGSPVGMDSGRDLAVPRGLPPRSYLRKRS